MSEPAPWSFTQRYGIDKMLDADSVLIWYKALLLCANGDGELAEAERDWVIGHALTYHPQLGQSRMDVLKTYDGTGSTEDIEKLVFSDPLAKMGRYALISEAIEASGADGEYSEGEKKTIRNMAAKLGISEAKVIELENLYEEQKALKAKFMKAWFPSGIPVDGIPLEDS